MGGGEEEGRIAEFVRAYVDIIMGLSQEVAF